MILTPKGYIPDFCEYDFTAIFNKQTISPYNQRINSGYYFIINLTLDVSRGNNIIGYLYTNYNETITLTNLSEAGTNPRLFSDKALKDTTTGTLEIWDFNDPDYKYLGTVLITPAQGTIYG